MKKDRLIKIKPLTCSHLLICRSHARHINKREQVRFDFNQTGRRNNKVYRYPEGPHVTLSVVVCNSQNYNLNFNSILCEHIFRRMNRKLVRTQYFNQLYINIKEKCRIFCIHVVFILLYKSTYDTIVRHRGMSWVDLQDTQNCFNVTT